MFRETISSIRWIVPGRRPTAIWSRPRTDPQLSAADVRQILDRAIATANQTRAMIRLPIGSRARMVIAVTDIDGTVLGLHRMPDATFFSIDVAVAKARNMVYFSGSGRFCRSAGNSRPVPPSLIGRLVSERSRSFRRESTAPVPDRFSICTCRTPITRARRDRSRPISNQNGIVFFPGALPLYRNGVLVGGLGVSGDGVEQDDYVTSGAAAGFEAPANSRADRVFIDGVRMPYLKFPRNPTQ